MIRIAKSNIFPNSSQVVLIDKGTYYKELIYNDYKHKQVLFSACHGEYGDDYVRIDGWIN